MVQLLKRYGEIIFYAITTVVALGLLIYGSCLAIRGFQVAQMSKVTKTFSYSSKPDESDEVPEIDYDKQMIVITKHSRGYDTENNIVRSLQDNGLINISGASQVDVYGEVNSDREGSYNINIVAKNSEGKSSANLVIVVPED
ncbi:hypothetical protein N5B56_01080 [Eubacterium sp. LFL-14]|uniref:Uncharacterized protein n=1 Tax=Eubacterium album TaxID=2978477 RepID=A0ABT2LWL2_9FIRM|nr:hypothetical protein [Eubacterium sp. LFL-14]MCT7397677.1 hypothetical protein [Eubacterium sp. LFL-14]